ncbi:hypothetical protein QP669_24740, partial [Escherichia coli]|nr:hypothetical protein [Escherichia coli]
MCEHVNPRPRYAGRGYKYRILRALVARIRRGRRNPGTLNDPSSSQSLNKPRRQPGVQLWRQAADPDAANG